MSLSTWTCLFTTFGKCGFLSYGSNKSQILRIYIHYFPFHMNMQTPFHKHTKIIKGLLTSIDISLNALLFLVRDILDHLDQ